MNRIYIVGFMGSGKSSQGKKLASKLKMPFYDLDKMMEEIEGCSISEIFAKRGESYFRELEADVLRSTILIPKGIIACGGGTPCFSNNLTWINSRGISVYFRLNPEMLFQRLYAKRSKRPLIAQMSDDELKTFITNKLREREYFYQHATHTFSFPEFDAKKIAATLRVLYPH